MNRPLRAFSLLEFAIALAIAGVVTAAAVSVTSDLMKSIKATTRRAELDQDARRLADFVVSTLQGVGGGPVRPWMAVWLEDANDGNHSDCGVRGVIPLCEGGADRLTLAQVPPESVTCAVVTTTLDATHGTLQAETDDAGACCLDVFPNNFVGNPGNPSGSTSSPSENRQAILEVNGSYEAVQLGTRSDGCVIDVTRRGDFPGLTGPNPTSNYATGSVTIVNLSTIFLSPDDHHLMQWKDSNGDGTATADEVRILLPRVFDFQLALGYDVAPENGVVSETLGSDDEWCGNNANDALGFGGLLQAENTALRMVQVGLVVGSKVQVGGGNTVQVLNGANVSDPAGAFALRSSTARAMFRNLLQFN
jgi:hypothetical protein